uniref:RRM domain-containing protein n=1 Tax=Romanomermis culicivorax TaxID=13658 RepID=A0A915JA64_ROMCU
MNTQFFPEVLQSLKAHLYLPFPTEWNETECNRRNVTERNGNFRSVRLEVSVGRFPQNCNSKTGSSARKSVEKRTETSTATGTKSSSLAAAAAQTGGRVTGASDRDKPGASDRDKPGASDRDKPATTDKDRRSEREKDVVKTSTNNAVERDREQPPPRKRSRSPSASRDRKRSPSPKPTRLHVGRLTRNVTKEHINEIFSVFGPVRGVDMPTDRTHTHLSRGFAYVEFENSDDAEKAMKHMDGGQIDGQEITASAVLIAKGPRRPSPWRRGVVRLDAAVRVPATKVVDRRRKLIKNRES